MINNSKRKTKFVAFLSFMFVMGILIANNDINSNGIQTVIQNSPIQREQPENITPKAALNSSQTTISNISNPFEVFTDDISTSYRHKVIVDQQNNIHVAWISASEYACYRIFYQNNQTWSPVINLSANGIVRGVNDRDRYIDLASSGNYIYLTWTRFDGGSTNYIYRAVLSGEFFILTPFTSSSINEYQSVIQVNPRGDCIIIYFVEFMTYMEIRGIIHYASTSFSSWSGFIVLDRIQDQGVHFTELRCTWDTAYNIHILVKATDVYPGIYYGRNSTTIGAGNPIIAPSNLILVSASLYDPSKTEDLMIKAHPRTGFVYFGWTNVTELNDYQIFIYNKTATATTFNTTACFSLTDITNTIKPDIAFDSQNKVIVVYHTSTSYIYYVPDFIGSPVQICPQNQFASVAVGGLNDDVFIVSKNGATNKLILTQIDRTGPSINVIYPGDNLAITGNMTFNVVVTKDTKVMTYEWYNDVNKDGWVNDGGVGGIWHLINETLANVNYTDGSIATMLDFSHTWNLGSSDMFGIILRINATDKNLLDQSVIFANITIDNNKPQFCQITGMVDQFGINGFTAKYGRRNVTVSFTVVDNCSRVKLVELYNGTGDFMTKLADNLTGNPASGTLIWQTTGFPDGNYTELFLVVYDHADLYNTTYYTQNVSLYIDNTGPIVNFLNVQQDQEYSREIMINMTTNSLDTRRVNVTYFNDSLSSTYINPMQFGNATLIDGVYTITWTTNGTPPLHGYYTINATAEDIYGNRRSTFLPIYIDNYGPAIQLISPQDIFKVGFIVDILAYVENDTISWKAGYDTGAISTFTQFKNIKTNVSIIDNGSIKILKTRLDLTGFTSGDFSIGIQTTDNQGFVTSRIVVGRFYNEIPKPPIIQSTSNSFYNTTTQKFAVLLLTYNNLNDPNTIYRIYRSLTPFNVKYLNTLNASDRLEILGENVGSKFCVGEVNASQLSSDDRNYIPFTDTPINPNTYYYIVMCFNQYGTPGNCSDTYRVGVIYNPPDPVIRTINLDDINAMPYVFAGVVVLMALISVGMVRGTKTVRREKAVKKSYENILDMEYNIENKEKAKTLTDRLDEMEANLSGEETKSSKKDVDVDDFLKMEVKEEKKESIIGSGGLRKCPGCGWTLSSTATKCPRCGRLLG